MPDEDGYTREVIRTVAEMMRLLEQTRQDITRATLPLFPRITGIERRLDEEAKDRPARQKELDERLNRQDKVLEKAIDGQNVKLDKIALRLDAQDTALGKQDTTLEAQDTVLKDISKWQRWRTLAELVVILIVIIWLAWPK